MFNLSEILEKTKENRLLVENAMDCSGAGFHPEENSIYTGLSDADKTGIYEYMHKVSLRKLVEKLGLREYLGPSTTLTTGTTAAAGAPYVIPDKIYAELFESARGMDLVPYISNVVDSPGATLKIDAEVPNTYYPKIVGGGGENPNETIQITQGTITPRTFTLSPQITNDMIEDSQFELMERHIDIAGRAMGDFSTKMCLFPIMDDHRATATTYAITGAYNGVNAGGTYVYASDVMEAMEQNNLDGFPSDVIVLPALYGAATLLKGEGAGTPIPTLEAVSKFNLTQNPIGTFFGAPAYIVINDGTTSGLWASAALQYYAGLYATTWHTLVLNKKYGIQTLRKRWLKIERYSDPIKDLQGAVVSSRQGHMVARADATCVISYA